MSGSPMLAPTDRGALVELAPVLRRAVGLAPQAVARLRIGGGTATVLVRLPFGVLVSRSVAHGADDDAVRDLTVAAAAALAWLDDPAAPPPPRRDADWRTGLPPGGGWRRVESVPDDVVRPLVRSGAMALKDAAEREGVPGASPRSEVADALLDAVVLTVSDDPVEGEATPGAGASAEITLRALSALTRMGFLPQGGQVHVDVAARWIRVVAGYGTVYLERPGGGLGILRL
jgi:hypothetical protein